MSNKNKKVCMTLSYIEHFFALAFTVNGCISIFALACLVDIPNKIMSSAIGLNICAIIAIKKYKSIIK